METPIKIIQLDAINWHTVLDYINAMRSAIGAPKEHGNSVDAFIDSMIYGGMNELTPPYMIAIRNWSHLPAEIMNEIKWLQAGILTHRTKFRAQYGHDVNVQLELW